jgi:hypothetical protein
LWRAALATTATATTPTAAWKSASSTAAASSTTATTTAPSESTEAAGPAVRDVAAETRVRAEETPPVSQRDNRSPCFAGRRQEIDQTRKRIERRLLAVAFLHFAGDITVLVGGETLRVAVLLWVARSDARALP